MQDTKNNRIKSYGQYRSRSNNKAKYDINKNYIIQYNQQSTELNFINKFQQWNLEIGFGYGENLIYQAQQNPNQGFIGIEVYENGIANLITAIDSNAINNIIIFPYDAFLLLEILPNNLIDNLFILFPDPWPKNKHRKRRLIQENNLNIFYQIMNNKANLYLASDIDSYIKDALIKISNDIRFCWQINNYYDWSNIWHNIYLTRYNKKAISNNRKAYYLKFITNKI